MRGSVRFPLSPLNCGSNQVEKFRQVIANLPELWYNNINSKTSKEIIPYEKTRYNQPYR